MDESISLARLGKAVLALLAVLVAGTLGFQAIIGEGFVPSFYRAVVTITLTGLDTQPPGDGAKLFTVVLLVSGVAIFLYVAGAVVEIIARGVVSGVFAERRRQREIDRLHDHYVICGYGRVGRRIAVEFERTDEPFVVVDHGEEAVAHAREQGVRLVEGSGTEDENLVAAGIERAKGLVVASDSDADNLYIVLSARNRCPSLLIVARASDEEAAKKLRLAGADRVVEPYLAAGRVMANLLLKPQVTALVDLMTAAGAEDFRFEEIEVLASCGQSGRTIGELRVRSRTGAFIVALRKRDGRFDTVPTAETLLEEGDVLVAAGTPEELRAVEDIFAPREAVAG